MWRAIENKKKEVTQTHWSFLSPTRSKIVPPAHTGFRKPLSELMGTEKLLTHEDLWRGFAADAITTWLVLTGVQNEREKMCFRSASVICTAAVGLLFGHFCVCVGVCLFYICHIIV